MIKNNQNQRKPASNQGKYLILNPAEVLDARVTSRVSITDDLVLKKLEEGIYHVLKDGKHIVECLNKLTSEHGYALVLYSDRNESVVTHALRTIDESSKQEGLTGLPKITAMIVKYREEYPSMKACDPKIAEPSSSEILIAGYSLQPNRETEILDGVSKLLSISISDLNDHILLNSQDSFVDEANRIGWNALKVNSRSVKKILADLCSGVHESTKNRYKRDLLDLKEEENKMVAEKNPEECSVSLQENHDKSLQGFEELQVKSVLGTEERKEVLIDGDLNKSSKPLSKVLGNISQKAVGSDHQQEELSSEKEEIEKTNATAIKPDFEEKSLDADDKDSQKTAKFNQSNQKNLLDQPEEENNIPKNHEDNVHFKSLIEEEDLMETTQNPTTLSKLPQKDDLLKDLKEEMKVDSKKDLLFQESLISNMKFKAQKKSRLGGSNWNYWFTHEVDDADWIGKISFQSSQRDDSDDEYKEYLASQIYTLFGVNMPQTVLARQTPSPEAQNHSLWKSGSKPRIHVMSKFVSGFEVLGKNFLGDYKSFNKSHPKQYFCIGKGKIPLKGFGRVMAVAILLDDYDFIGNSGGNIGLIPKEDGKYFEILKIDPGEALCPAKFTKDVWTIQSKIKDRGAVGGTNGQTTIYYAELNEFDQNEFIQTLKEILEIEVSKLQEMFSPYFNINQNFETALEELLNRRKELFAAFADEIGDLIDSCIRNLEEKQAEEFMTHWDKPPKRALTELEQKGEMVRNKAQLQAFKIASDTNSAEAEVFQVSHKKARFVGRDSELTQIRNLFNSNSGIIKCAVVGAAGMGKSQLATEYIIRSQEEMYSHVIWLHAQQSDLILDQIQIYLETTLNIKFDPKDQGKKAKVINKLYQVLGDQNKKTINTPKKVCIFFDNADSMSDITDYLPDKKRFPNFKIDILVTSRLKNWEDPLEMIIELQEFGVLETQNYIRAYYSDTKISTDDDQLLKDAERLNALLGGLPLAISLGIAYIQQNKITVGRFCDIVEEQNKTGLFPYLSQEPSEKKKETKEHGGESKGLSFVSTVLTLSLFDLRFKNSVMESILDVIAYLSPDRIRKNLLKKFWKACQYAAGSLRVERVEKLSSENAPSPQIQESWKELFDMKSIHEEKGNRALLFLEDFESAFELMLSYSLVTPNTINEIQIQSKENEVDDADTAEVEIKIHRLTQQVIRRNHQRSNIYEDRYKNVFERVLDDLAYDKVDMKDVRRAGFVISHGIYLESLQNNIKRRDMAKLCDQIGSHQFYVGKCDIALKYFEKAFEIKEKHYEKDHPETSLTLTSLGNAWGYLGDYERKKNLLTRALEINEKHYGKDHPETSTTLTNLGNAWGELGDDEKSKDLLTRALEIKEKHYGKDHPSTGITLTNLGTTWGSLGDYEKQKDLLTRALEIKEKHYGKDHQSTSFTLTNLGNAWGYLGDYEKQKDLLTRALEIKEKHFGKDHPNTGITLTNLGYAWGSLGDYEKSKDLMTRALEIFEKHHGNDYPIVGITLTNLGNAWGELGNYKKSKDLLTRALEINEKHFGKNHPETSITLTGLGNAWGSFGDYERKKNLLTRALEINEKRFGKDHPETSITLTSLGNAWESLGDYEKSKELLTRALEIKEKHYGKDHPSTGITLTSLGNAWESLGDYEKSKELLTRALEIKEKHYGKDHPSTGITLTSLGSVWGSLGDYEKSKDLLTRALEIKEKHYGKDHPETGITLTNLGSVWGSLDDYEKSKDLLTRALEIKEKHFGKDHPETSTTLTNLGNAWGSLGDYERKKNLLNRALEIKEKHSAKDHPETSITLTSLGNAWESLGVYEKSNTSDSSTRNL